MSEFQINDHLFSKECDDLAASIFAEVFADSDTAKGMGPDDWRDEMTDRAHETADGHEWVIYNYKALMICAHCDVSEGEAFREDVGMPSEVTIYKLACMIVYGEMRARIEAKLQELADEWEAPEGWYGFDDEDAA